LAISKLDTVSIVSDTGEVQWAFVKDAAAQVQAKYIASLKNMPKQTEDFIVFCNPK
jgi:sensor domain CHASE-containing protein